MTAAPMGVKIQHKTTFLRRENSAVPLAKPMAISAPTMACEADIGRARPDMMNITNPADRAARNARLMSNFAREPTVLITFGPSTTAPTITNTATRQTAVRYFTRLAATPVPMTLAASLAPNPQPRNAPLEKYHILIRQSFSTLGLHFNRQLGDLVGCILDFIGNEC